MAKGLSGMVEVLASTDMIKKQRQEKKEKKTTRTERRLRTPSKTCMLAFFLKLVKILDAFLGPQIV